MIERILFISIFKEGNGGGEGRVAFEMARWFSRSYQVVMLCPGEKTGLTVDPTGFKQFNIQSTGEQNLSVPLLSAANLQKIFSFLDSFQPQIIHVHDPALLGIIGQLWAKIHKVPIFYTAHLLPSRVLDFGTNEVMHNYAIPINESLVERYLLNFYTNCDAVIALNKIVEKEIRHFGYSGRMFTIPNGRDLGLYHSVQYADISTKEKQLAFVGFLSKRKNQQYLMEVMKYLPPGYRLQLVGDPLVPEYLDELKRIVSQNHLNVTFCGKLEQKEIASLLENTHVFVSASKMEVQSLVIIEALASGTPVVGLTNETISELVDNNNGACLPADTGPQSFAETIQKVCKLSPDKYTTLCNGARERVKDLDWSTVMIRTVESYDSTSNELAAKKESRHNREHLFKVISSIPPGILHDELTKIITSLDFVPKHHPPVSRKLVWLAFLNMAASTAGYYILKGPVHLVRMLTREKKNL